MNEPFCSVCVENATTLTQIKSPRLNGVKTAETLKSTIPEIEWDDNWLICGECSAKVDDISNFRANCIQKEELRKEWVIFAQLRQETESGDAINKNKNLNNYPVENSIGEVKNEILIKLCDVRIKRSPQKKLKVYKCDECQSSFNTSSNLLQHKRYHSGDRTNICSYCGKGFISKGDLKVHEKQHLNKREYECDACAKTFNTNKNLRSHKLVVHTNPSQWNYVCGFCDKRFPIKSNLDQHIRRHTGDKRFVCHLCEKRFTDKVVLQKHIKSHSNYRAYKCERCEKEYKDKGTLEIHLAKVHGVGNAKVPVREKKYLCQVCPKAYFAKNKLTRHVFSHTGEKPYFCEICQKKFTDKSYVKQHLKTVHGVVCKFD